MAFERIVDKELLKNLTAQMCEQRTAWNEGALKYADELIDSIPDEELSAPVTWERLEKLMLNGAESWQDYSYGGNALIYDGDIAERMCTPREFKDRKYGDKEPNPYELWLDVQTRALYDASRKIFKGFVHLP